MVDAATLLIMAGLLPGMSIQSAAHASSWAVAAAAALLLGLMNFLIRPVLLLLAMPFGMGVILLAGLFVNALLISFTAFLLPSFHIETFWSALLGGLVFALINTFITNLMTIDDQNSFYEYLIERRARREQLYPQPEKPEVGVIFFEVDGLSYFHFRHALAEGYLPNLEGWIQEQGYQLHRIETGLPSMTTSCQAGILYGDNQDIPSFRWFDRDLKRLIISQPDAGLLEARLPSGGGLIRGGSSIGNMFSGGANKSIFVLSTLRSASEQEKKQRAQDIYLVMLDPYFFLRSMIKVLADAILEILQYFRQVIQNAQPRLNRLHKGYPLLRAAITSLFKDLCAYLIFLDLIRGAPAIYHTYLAYDEMAHHAGPWSPDSFRELRRMDRLIARLLYIIEQKTPRPYELILLSDHGQSQGHTFLQRYGITLGEFILQLLPGGTRLTTTQGGDDGTSGVISMMNELDNLQDQSPGGETSRAILRRANRLVKEKMERLSEDFPAQADEIKVAVSGNLANVYFTQFGQRAHISEINHQFPGLIDALVQHEGVGFVVGLDDDNEPICFGKDGARNLHTGDILGDDPLGPFVTRYASAELRAAQLKRLSDYPSAGDLIINSPIYPDGSVAAYEELIGNHGGLGGEQTDAFLLAPGDLEVPSTQNASDLFSILKTRLNRQPTENQAAIQTKESPISGMVIGKGILGVDKWLSLGMRALRFDQAAYLKIARDPYQTGPALVIWVCASLLTLIYLPPTWQNMLINLSVIPLASLTVWLAGRALKSRQDFLPVWRTTLFAQLSYLWLLVGIIPPLRQVAPFVAIGMTFLNTWIGANAALELRGWKTVILPVIALVFAIFGAWALRTIALGAEYTLESLLEAVGLR